MGEWKDKYDHYAYVEFTGVDEKNILDYVPVTVVNWNETEIVKNPLPIKNTNVKGITTRTVTLYAAPNSKTKAATLPKGQKVTYTFLKDEKYYGWKEVKWDVKVKTYVTQKYYVTVKYYKKVNGKKVAAYKKVPCYKKVATYKTVTKKGYVKDLDNVLIKEL
ncbi:hypothetical protein [Carboxydothermus hydrogenoformans]|uniref:Uncharacterized protein n=1 Tax=Carboxydothermus hydrogenoformans (strain ATCC BAA-161 / DSM 6008 / Z-2901) TaxID=246194 RepID=Q3AA47_CARHZ|nr:hypothetical protein [Carboxydothermus hydrogenoformans]ABB13834.1 hypothetical protein CHY_2173 [Carboxydothermus hydrogenoformans Z-2901]